jgi:hypothetical protein
VSALAIGSTIWCSCRWFGSSGARSPCYNRRPADVVIRRLFMSAKTYTAKPGEIERRWHVVDAEGQTLGRLATRIADVLRGKDKPVYTPHVDTGDFVIVVNAEKIAVTGKKLDDKIYYRHSATRAGSSSARCASSSTGARPRCCASR